MHDPHVLDQIERIARDIPAHGAPVGFDDQFLPFPRQNEIDEEPGRVWMRRQLVDTDQSGRGNDRI